MYKMPYIVLLRSIILMPLAEVLAVDCRGVDTSEGSTTLHHGEHACAPLRAGETYRADAGKRYLTCNNGHLLTKECASGLRWDMKISGCNWPNQATCNTDSIPGSSGLSATENPTPRPWTPAPAVSPCNATICSLPDCFCYGDTPTGVSEADTPMFIMLTFDDAITATMYEAFYRDLFIDNTYNITNPTGCNIKSAYYVIEDNTDFEKVKFLAQAGNEIASHTIHHTLATGDTDSDYLNISAEIDGMRDRVFYHTQDSKISDNMVGFRAPYLRVAGNVMFDVLRDFNFLYDTSIVNVETYVGRKALWPFTLDFPVKSCVNPPCPTKMYPGLWEVPLNDWIGDDGYSCGMIDGCSVGDNLFTASEQSWYNYCNRNFQDYFYKNKVPMHMFTHASMFLRSSHSFNGLVKWLQDITAAHNDVWLVSPRQVIEWMQNQQTNADMITNKWAC